MTQHLCNRCESVRDTERQLLDMSSEEDDGLAYPELDHSSESFRLLRLLPAHSNTAEMSCLLFSATHSDWKGKYIAGSYVCGTVTPGQAIYVNGSRTSIGQNLYEFLTAIRRFCEDANMCTGIVLWIDAICIDQRSIKERNHQVGLMKQIFEDASATYSWLGHEQGDSNWLFDNVISREPPDLQPHSSGQVTSTAKKFFQPELDPRRLAEAVSNLTDREYFKRLWILQEVVLAPRILLFCGTKSMKLAALTTFLQSLIDHVHPAAEHLSDLKRALLKSMLWSMCEMRKTRFWTSSFEDLFWQFGSLACSLLHDKIFSLMSLAPFRNWRDAQAMIRYDCPLILLIGSVIQLAQLSDPFRFAMKALAELHINPLCTPIQSIGVSRNTVANYEEPFEFFLLNVCEDSTHYPEMSLWNGSSPLKLYGVIEPFNITGYVVARLTSFATFAQYIVLATAHAAPPDKCTNSFFLGFLTTEVWRLGVVHESVSKAIYQTLQALSSTTYIRWSPVSQSRECLQATLRIRYDLFGALVHLSNILDHAPEYKSLGNTDEAALTSWNKRMDLILQKLGGNHPHTSTWQRRDSTDYDLPEALTDPTRRLSDPGHPDMVEWIDQTRGKEENFANMESRQHENVIPKTGALAFYEVDEHGIEVWKVLGTE